MPIPFIVGAIAAVAAASGVGAGVYGAKKMKDASDSLSSAKSFNERNIARLNKTQESTASVMDMLGNKEIAVLQSFTEFQDAFEKIHNRPPMDELELKNFDIPSVSLDELHNISVAAAAIMSALKSAAAGTAGGIAASGAVTALVACGTASTGTLITGLSGAAATNAVLAALGGGSLAAGGGGMALGTAVLTGASLGVGLLVGGAIFAITGSKLSDKADAAWRQVRENEKKIDKSCAFLSELSEISQPYYSTLSSVFKIYRSKLADMQFIISSKQDWNCMSSDEQKVIQNTVSLVGLLYAMCKVKLVKQAASEEEINEVNKEEAEAMLGKAKGLLEDPGLTD